MLNISKVFRTLIPLFLLLTLITATTLRHQLVNYSSASTLSGKSFSIVGGEFTGSVAKFIFARGRLAWTQCNSYRCSYKQQGFDVTINQCFNTLMYCGDPIEQKMFEAVQAVRKFTIENNQYKFTDALGKIRLVLRQV